MQYTSIYKDFYVLGKYLRCECWKGMLNFKRCKRSV